MNYTAVRQFLLNQGARLLELQKTGMETGQTKVLEQEIERNFFEVLSQDRHDVVLYGEDINRTVPQGNSYWIIDPISGTNHFDAGTSDYALCAAEVSGGQITYAIIVAPAYDEFFEAHKGKGVMHNYAPLQSQKTIGDLILNLDPSSIQTELQQHIWKSSFSSYPFVLNQSSALSYCRVAQRRYRRVISVSKDSFPYYAGTFIINESGGRSTNKEGSVDITPNDDIFVGAIDEKLHAEAIALLS